VRPEKYRERYVSTGPVIEQLPEPPRSTEELNQQLQERIDGLPRSVLHRMIDMCQDSLRRSAPRLERRLTSGEEES
jgi:hypothetical protein